MTSIKNLNEDVLTHILEYTEQTLTQKVDEISSILELNNAIEYMKTHKGNLRVKLAFIIKKNSVFRLKFKSKNEILEGTYLIHNTFLTKKCDMINICPVKPSLDKRIFGYYEITGLSTSITSGDLMYYELLYSHVEPSFVGNDYFGVMDINPNYIHFNHLIFQSNKIILGQIRKVTKTKITLILDYHQIDNTRPLNSWTYMKFKRNEVFDAEIEYK